MDAHNAAEPDQTKPAGSPSQRRRRDSEARPASDAAAPVSPGSEKKRREGSAEAPDDRDSDAETIVLPGKDGHSPSKARKVRQEDKSDGDAEASKDGQSSFSGPRSEHESNGKNGKPTSGANDSSDVKKKRPSDAADKSKDKSGSGKGSLSSAPESPQIRRRRRSVDSYSSHSDSGQPVGSSSVKPSPRHKERALPTKRKASRSDSDEDEEDTRKARRQRTTSNSIDTGRPSRERRASHSKSYAERPSVSPPLRSHRRSASSQFASSNGPNYKKKRLPPPLNTTEYHSDESSASGSPYPRGSKAKSLAASSTADPSPAKRYKKHLDAHGQTLLARACARGEFEGAKQRLRERPEDLNVADFAGNTPLQIAAINGCEDIVELLIDAGCNLDCVNYDKDTPLLDAVDNGHLDVVKLLLDAGVNPRKANVNGEEPIDRLSNDTDNVDEIRAALIEAKKRFGGRTKTSEDRESHLQRLDAPDSPRRSPATAMGSSRRGGNVRSTKTRNDLLYQPLDDKTLRQAAGRGDEEIVARILQVKTSSVSDAEPMVAAARGGHDLVIQLLLGLGGADPDPGPIPSQPAEFATPILAAIGQENFKVLELLLEQPQVDPTKRFRGETYYEIARRRQGTNWKEEEQLLKDAYDAHKTSGKLKTKSPGRRERDKEREEKRARREERTEGRPHKRDAQSPEHDTESRKKLPAKLGSPKAKRRTDSQSHPSDKERPRKKEDRMASMQGSDREHSPSVSHKQSKIRRNDSEVAVSSDGEAAKPRRKLISKGELRGEQRRRSSVHSNPSTAKEQPSSPHESRNEDPSDKSKVSEKYHDRAKALKREESRDPGASGEHSTKRHRASLTPDRAHNGDKDDGEAPSKKRRLESEGSEKRKKRSSDSEGPARKAGPVNEDTKSSDNGTEKLAGDGKDEASKGDSSRNGSRRPSGAESNVRIKAEDDDVEMPDVEPQQSAGTANPDSAKAEAEERAQKDGVLADEAAKKKQEEAEAESKKQKEVEEAEEKRKQKEEEEEAAKRKEQEEAERKKQKEEEERKQAEELKAQQEAEAQARREQEEEKKRREEEQRQKEEEERKKREEEEERLRKEREAEEARRKREEDERKERERREELERKRAAERRAREQQEKARLEQLEKARLDKLPPLLRWLDTCPNPKNRTYAEKFATMQGVRYDTIRPETNHTPEGREQWVLNTHAALLLGEKDLALTRCEFMYLQIQHFIVTNVLSRYRLGSCPCVDACQSNSLASRRAFVFSDCIRDVGHRSSTTGGVHRRGPYAHVSSGPRCSGARLLAAISRSGLFLREALRLDVHCPLYPPSTRPEAHGHLS